MSYKFSVGKAIVQDYEFRGLTELSGNLTFLGNSEFSASLVNASAISASVVSGSDYKGKWTGEGIVNSYISDVAASKLTGQLANARVVAANITQHTGSITAMGSLTSITMSAGAFSTWGSTTGTGGYGLWDDEGTIKFKNEGGSWAALGVGVDLADSNRLGAAASDLQQITGTLAVSGSALATPALFVSSSNFRVGIGTRSPSHDFDVSGDTRLRGGVVVSRRAKTSNYTLATDDYIVGVDTSGGAVTITLPDADTFTSGQVFIIKDEGAAAATYNITVTTDTSGDKIDGQNSVILDVNRASINLYTNGSDAYFIY